MAEACGGRQGRASTGKSGTPPSQFISGFSSVSSTEKNTIRLRDIYNPEPQPAKAAVRIRPPGPIVSSCAKSPELMRSLSSEPPTTPIMRRRAQSLPSSTERKREAKVRFVDSMGLQLEEVKVFKVSERPQIPPYVKYRLLMSSELAFGKSVELSLPLFKPCFCDNRGAQSDFLKCVQSQRVCLEQVQCSELGISGTIQVLNLAFEKKVRVQYSFTNWRTFTDTMASWVSTICRGEPDSPETDIFCFRLPVPPFILQPGAVLEFAICYEVEGSTYWDNNDGRNYKLSCHSYKVTVPKECEGSLLHFT